MKMKKHSVFKLRPENSEKKTLTYIYHIGAPFLDLECFK